MKKHNNTKIIKNTRLDGNQVDGKNSNWKCNQQVNQQFNSMTYSNKQEILDIDWPSKLTL